MNLVVHLLDFRYICFRKLKERLDLQMENESDDMFNLQISE